MVDCLGVSPRNLLILAVLLYGAFLVRYSCLAASGADSSGYFNAARLIARGEDCCAALRRPAECDSCRLRRLCKMSVRPLDRLRQTPAGERCPSSQDRR